MHDDSPALLWDAQKAARLQVEFLDAVAWQKPDAEYLREFSEWDNADLATPMDDWKE